MRILAVLAAIVLLGSFAAAAGAASPSARAPDSLDRVDRGVMQGTITQKDAVLLKAKLLYDRRAASAVAAKLLPGGTVVVDQPCMTSFFKEVRQVYGQLSIGERGYLSALSPDLRVIMRSESAAAKGGAKGELPDFDLDETIEGTYCEVNYTSDGENAVPDKAFAKLVKTYIDGAVTAETKVFRTAYAEGDGKLQVYLLKDEDAWGTWIDVSDAEGSGKPKAGYIKISTLKDTSGNWKTSLKGTCYHEYFHGVQSAYNWESSLWFMEGTCTWAQTKFAKDWGSLETVFGSSSSCFKSPGLPLWDNSYHKYSTVAWAYHLADQYDGASFIKSYFEATEDEDDALLIQKDLLSAEGSSLPDQIKSYAWAVYTKNIRSIKASMPAVAVSKVSSYGINSPVNGLYQTGLVYAKLTPMKGIPEATLLMNFVPGAVGAPEAFFFEKGSNDLLDMTNSASQGLYPDYVASFGKGVKEVCFVITDTEYSAEDATVRDSTVDFITPRFLLKRLTAESPITAGESSKFTIQYDLLGTHGDQATFPVELKIIEKGPDVSDNASGDYELAPGKGQLTYLYFNTDSETEGTYRFTLEYRVPCMAWATQWTLPQVKSSAKTSVVVKQPEDARKRGAGAALSATH